MTKEFQKKMTIIMLCKNDCRKRLVSSLESIKNQTVDIAQTIVFFEDKDVNIQNVNESHELPLEKILKEYDVTLFKDESCDWNGFFKSFIKKEIIGDYVFFMEAGDLLSVDTNRLFLRKINETEADMIFANHMYINFEGKRYYHNLEPSHYQMTFEGTENSLELFFEFAPRSDVFNSIRGKGFSTTMFCAAIDDELEINERKGGDICQELYESALLYVLFQNTDSIERIENAFFFEHEKRDEEKYLVDNDIFMEFFEETLSHIGEKNSYLDVLLRHLKVYNRVKGNRFRLIYSDSLKGKNKEDVIIERLKMLEETYYQSIVTELDDAWSSFEDMKLNICSDITRVVSFDLFDTLVKRKVFEPVDIFRYLDKPFNDMVDAKNPIVFHKIRQECEESCRENVFLKHPQYEDITFDEIYEEIGRLTVFSDVIIDEIKNKELQLEESLCITRDTGKELYELASDCNKRIIIITDMYLPINTIEKILKKNGFVDYEKVYLSSYIRLGKWTTNLYRYVLKDLKLKSSPESMVHIGDNWVVDVENPKKIGIRSFHLSNGRDLFRGENPGIYKGGFFGKIFQPNGDKVDGRCAFDLFSGIRIMSSLVTNRFYDSPYINFNHNSDFNADPYFIGYFLVGMHLLAIVEWITVDTKAQGYNKIHFLGRDGYLPIEAYKIWNANKKVPDVEYTYMSRYIIPFSDIDTKEDIYNLMDKMNVLTSTPEKIVKIFESTLNEDRKKIIRQFIEEKGFLYSQPLKNYSSSYAFLKVLAEELIDFNKLQIEKEKMSEYFKTVFRRNDCIFDMGYNGRVETALSAALGFPVDSYYIHLYKELTIDRSRNNDFVTHCFYDFQPVTTFLVREQIFSKLDSSIKRVYKEDDAWKFEFGDYDVSPATEWVTDMIQRGALQFIKDMRRIVDGFAVDINWRYQDASLPFEYYMHYSKYLDRAIFSPASFEDEFGENVKFNLADYWAENLRIFKTVDTYDNTSNSHMNELEYDSYRLKEIEKSFSYRLGMFFTAIPRWIKNKRRKK